MIDRKGVTAFFKSTDPGIHRLIKYARFNELRVRYFDRENNSPSIIVWGDDPGVLDVETELTEGVTILMDGELVYGEK